MASSSPPPSNGELAPSPSDAESQLSSLIYDLSSQIQVAMENMLKMISEIDQNSSEISEDIEKCKGCAFERKKVLEDEKENFHRAAYAVIDMLNNERSTKAASFNCAVLGDNLMEAEHERNKVMKKF